MNVVTQESQSDVHNFYQTSNPIMPSTRKRARSSSKPRTTNSSKIKTTGTKNIWPYRSLGNGPMWDPFPVKTQAILRYSATVVLDPALGIPAPHLFRAGSIFDPDYTGVGHQPYGHDTYQQIYNHYRVSKSTITMTPTSTVNGIYGISLTDDVSVNGDYNVIRETKGTKIAINTANKGPSVVQVYSNKQNFPSSSTSSSSAIFGGNPEEDMYFHCWFEGMNQTNEPIACSFLITISYIVDMWELKDLGQS